MISTHPEVAAFSGTRDSSDLETVLVTGASSGIGRELARGFASKGFPLVIVAPLAAELLGVAEEIQEESGVRVRAIPKDLRSPDAARELFGELKKAGLKIGTLVNHAGLGYHGNFSETPLEYDLEMIRINIEAMVRLTKLFLPAMIARGHGRILNTASTAGFEPGPTLAVYHASKAFVLSWSEGLAMELQEKGVTVTTLCPGAVETDFFIQAGLADPRSSLPREIMGPREVAEAAVDAALRGDRVIVPAALNRIVSFPLRASTTTSAKIKLRSRVGKLFADKFQGEAPKRKSKAG